MSDLKPFHNILNYVSTANIEEVMKFYNLGNKTFETDFSTCTLVPRIKASVVKFVQSVDYKIIYLHLEENCDTCDNFMIELNKFLGDGLQCFIIYDHGT